MPTVKVESALHSRLVHRAAAEGTTIGGVITRSLDVLEESEFWAEVERTMTADRVRAAAEEFSGTLTDGLDMDETWEDVL